MRKLLLITRNIAAVIMIMQGCVGFWSRHIPTGISFLLAGICTLQSFWALLGSKARILKAALPILLTAIGIGYLFVPKESVTTAFPVTIIREQTTVYVTPSGTKYHYKQNCAGEAATQIQKDTALQNGYAPCAKCVK